MNAFIIIAQKVVKTNTTIRPHEEMIDAIRNDKNNLPFSILHPHIWKNYYDNESKIDKDNTIYWMYHYINALFFGIDEHEVLKFALSNSEPLIYSIRSKFQKYKEVMDNIFLSDEIKEAFAMNVMKAQ